MDVNDLVKNLEKHAKPADRSIGHTREKHRLSSIRRLAKKYAKDVGGIYKETKFGAIVKTKNCTVVFTKGGNKNAKR